MPVPPATPRLPSVSPSRRSRPPSRQTGARPNRRPLPSESASAKTSTRRSSPISWARGMVPGPSERSASSPQTASRSPQAPPSTPSSRLSSSSSFASRAREAPSAERIVTSRIRPATRASVRLATLAQAMRRTSATAPMNTSSAGRTSPTICSRRPTTSAPQLVLLSGYWASSRLVMVVISSCARSTVTPFRSRPNTVRKSARRGRVLSVARGVQISIGCSSRSAVGTIPTTVCGNPLSSIWRPTMSGCAANRRRQ